MNKIVFNSYKEFWPYYLTLHSKPGTRLLHVVGLLVGILILTLSCCFLKFSYLLLAPIAGYTFAWISHFFIEKNRPAAWQYPWWSFISDFKMASLVLRGKL